MRFCISIHAPHTGRDSDRSLSLRTGDTNFNPRAPYGARRFTAGAEADGYTFQSTRPIRGATIHDADTLPTGEAFQSTRPIGGATALRNPGKTYLLISIHAPHTGRDSYSRPDRSGTPPFQSTRPIRGATPAGPVRRSCRRYFNPRAPYGARRKIQIKNAGKSIISIHAPHTGRDPTKDANRAADKQFQSTRPIRGATHPLRGFVLVIFDFNPRAPYGARHYKHNK